MGFTNHIGNGGLTDANGGGLSEKIMQSSSRHRASSTHYTGISESVMANGKRHAVGSLLGSKRLPLHSFIFHSFRGTSITIYN